ncbi:MAG: M67 family metallopeptidase [Armatimonadota bacterium]
MLILTPEALETIREHSRRGYPLEICGLLAGSVDGDARTVTAVWPVRNSWEEDAEERARLIAAMEASGAQSAGGWDDFSEERRFLVSPADMLQAMKRERAEGVKVVGVYHTHPNHPAQPSQFDLDAAWPEWSYLILSVRGGEVAEERSWVLNEAEGRFVEEQVLTER